MQQTFAAAPDIRTVVSPDNILVATDRTDIEFLLPYALAQAKASHARLTLVSAITPGVTVPVESASPYIDMVKVKKQIVEQLHEQAARIEAQGVSCDVHVECGLAVDILCEQLRATRAQRLVMGTHGRGKLGRLTLGSVASEILRTVQVPVFAIGPKAHGRKLNEMPKRILHPVSFDGDYRKGVQFAIELARANHAELTLMLVLNRYDKKDVNPERTLEWGRNALRALPQSADALQTPVKVEAVFGKVPEEVCKMAEQIAADLIVIGVSGTIRFSPLAENTAYKVLAQAGCPVMTAPHEVRVKEPAVEPSRELTGVHFESDF